MGTRRRCAQGTSRKLGLGALLLFPVVVLVLLVVVACGGPPAKEGSQKAASAPSAAVASAPSGPLWLVPAAPTRWVTDGVGFLSEAARRELDASLKRYEVETGHQVIVWIGDSTHGQRLEDFATRSFNAWGIGRKGANDGVAFFVFSDDRKIRLEVGDGLVGVLPNSTAAAIINEVVTPRLASGEKDQALVKGVAVTLRVLNGEQWKSLEGAFRAPSSDAAPAERGR